MLALRYAGLLALTVWVGGLLALGAIAAPAIFDVLAARQVADDRVLAGAIFGEILRRFHLLSYAAGSCCSARCSRAACSARGRAVRHPPRRSAFVMLAATAYSGVIVSGADRAAPGGDRRRPVEPAGRRIRAASRSAGCTRLSTGLQLVPSSAGWSCCSGS